MAQNEYNGQAADEAQCWQLVEELLELRCETAATLGRDQYAYRVLDDGIESGCATAMRRARAEFELVASEAL